jgi:DNA-binding transcriptional ArsR family regulator/uncharacterized protein YndB with AHSA1/START domain
MSAAFKALGDPTRRRLLDDLNERDGQTLQQLSDGLEIARQSVSKHLAVLEDAHLITTVRRGREKLHYLNAAPITAIADRWIQPYNRTRVAALTDLTRTLERKTMSKPTFVYTTYIDTTPEELWSALTQPEFTSKYWGTRFDTDWKVGSEMTWHYGDVTIADPEQIVLESDPFTRLSYTWQSITPEMADAVGWADDYRDRLAAERKSKVAFEIEQSGALVKLIVIHDDFDEGSEMLGSISGGWPMVISSLKTLLETGTTEPAAFRRRREGVVAQ